MRWAAREIVLFVPLFLLPVACGGATFSTGEADGGVGRSSSGAGGTSSGAASGSGGASSGSTSSGSSSGGPGSSSGGAGSSGSGSSGSSSGAASSGGDSGLVASCPSSTPASGAACSTDGLQCEYGSNPVQSCDTVATCTQSVWQIVGPATSNMVGAGSDCSTEPALGCPATFNQVPQGTSCAGSTLECNYPQGRCACTEGGGPVRVSLDGGLTTFWACQVPAAGCPVPRAPLGSACMQDITCDYGSCDIPGGTAEACNGGVWKQAFTPCPL